MAPNKCSYTRCENTSEHKSMFRFPWKDKNRLKVWLDNCGNYSIAHLPPERLRAKYLCIDHFNVKYVRNETGQRKRLQRTAFPEHYRAAENTDHSCTFSHDTAPGSPESKVIPKIVYTNKKVNYCDEPEELGGGVENTTTSGIRTNTEMWNSPKRRKINGNENDTPECKLLKTRLCECQRKLRRVTIKNISLRNEIKDKNVINLSKHKFNSATSKMFTLMQLRKPNSKRQWNDEEKQFCMSLYSKSPAAYKFLLNSGIVLAGLSTTQRWLQDTNSPTEIND